MSLHYKLGISNREFLLRDILLRDIMDVIYNFIMGEIFRRFVFWFLNHLYRSLAWAYDFIANLVSLGQWYEWNYQISNFLDKQGDILEIGIGTGKLHRNLICDGHKLYGCDLSYQMLRISSRNLKNYHANLFRANNLNLPFDKNSFDKIFATFPSEYVFSKSFFDEIKRVLKQGGEVIILLSVVFGKRGFINYFYQLIYKISGQSSKKDITEKIIQKYLAHESNIKILWYPYKNVELCFLFLKNQ